MTDASKLYQYVIPDTSGIPLAPRIRTSEEVTPESIRLAVDKWKTTSLRYQALYCYAVGIAWQDVFGTYAQKGMEMPSDVENARVLTNYCGYIVQSLKGYIVGVPPEYECEEDDAYAEMIYDLFRDQRKETVDATLIEDMVTYGRAFELVYLDEKGIPKSTVISPKSAFVTYSGDVEEDSMFGVVYYEIPQDNNSTLYRIFVYTSSDVQIFESTSDSDSGWVLVKSEPHIFGRVPLIEYANNRNYMGDFEPIIALQNVYNRTLLNRVADKDAFVKSILLLMGQAIGMDSDEVKESLNKINDTRVLQLTPESSASYLEKSMDETGVQVLQDQIKSDIHKISHVPDMSDEQFSNNASGVAMDYKLFGLNQLIADKTISFQKGFTRRCKLYDSALFNPTKAEGYEPTANIGAMRIKFRLNTPQDLAYLGTFLTQVVPSGIVSKATARKLLRFVGDAEVEEDRVKSEADEESQRMRDTYDTDFRAQGGYGEVDGETSDEMD